MAYITNTPPDEKKVSAVETANRETGFNVEIVRKPMPAEPWSANEGYHPSNVPTYWSFFIAGKGIPDLSGWWRVYEREMGER